MVVSSAKAHHLDQSLEGVCKSYWMLQAGQPQRHASWQIPNVLGVSVSLFNKLGATSTELMRGVYQYAIRVTIEPPYLTAQKPPAFRYLEPIRVTSDAWIDPVLTEATVDNPALGL